jgi:hypothetical protein
MDALARGEADGLAVDDTVDEVGLADEVRDPAARRALVKLGGRAELCDPSRRHHGDAVGHGQRLFLVVGDIDHGRAELGLQALDLDLHVLAQLLVERAERLVHQKCTRIEHQCPGQRDALLLTAGELARHRPGRT